MSKNKINFEVVKFANVETPNFIQQQRNNNTSKPYLPYGEDNCFPDQLIFMSDKSTTHAACLNLIQLSIAGEGYTTKTDDAKSWLELQDFATDSSTILEKSAPNMAVLDGFAFETIWSKAGKTLVSYSSVPMRNLRIGATDEYGKILTFLSNPDWSKNPSGYTEIDAFDPLSKAKKQIVYITFQNIISDFYPVPKYCSSINYIYAESELSKFNLSSIVNGFSPSFLMTIVGNATEEEQTEIKNKFKKQFQGAENTNKIITSFVESIDQKINIDEISASNMIDQYMNTAQENKERICTAHGINRQLVGVDDNTSLFSNGESLKVIYDTFYNFKIKPYQKAYQKTINMLLKYAGFPDEDFKIIPFTPQTIIDTGEASQTNDTTGNETVSNALPDATNTIN